MRYLKTHENFLSDIKDSHLIENVNLHRTHIKNLGTVQLPDPEYGDLKLSVMPFENNGEWVSLPEGFKIWEESFNNVLKFHTGQYAVKYICQSYHCSNHISFLLNIN